MTMQPPAKFVTGRIMGNASEPIADPTSEMSQTPETDAVFAQHKNIAWVDEWKCAQALLELARSLETRLRAAEEERSAYWTVLELLCERFPDRPIGDLPGSVDEQSARIASLEAELERVRKDAAKLKEGVIAWAFPDTPNYKLRRETLEMAERDSAAQSAGKEKERG